MDSYPQIASLIHILIMKEIKYFKSELRQLMYQLVKRDDYSTEAVFNTLCLYPVDPVIKTSGQAQLDESVTTDYISERSLFKFFRRNGFFASKEDIQSIVNRLDLNYDEVITREELSKFVLNASKLVGTITENIQQQ